MARYGIAIDTSACMACYNCFVACKDEHCGFDTTVSKAQPHTGQFWIKIDEWERGDDDRKIKTATVATPCSHCTDGACEKAAEGGAVYRRDDGIVIIDPEKAKGQKQIADACPIGAVYWNEALELPQKCTMCAHLLDEGYKEPRCVEVCPNGALFFGDLDDPNSTVSKKIAAGKITQLKALEGVRTNVIHLNIPTVFFAGSVYLPGDEAGDEAADGAVVTLRKIGDSDEDSGGGATNGAVAETKTNYFGDFEFEDLEKDARYELHIAYPGYQAVTLTKTADTDHFLGEFILESLR
ncbi:MAG: oxidoreductase [Clostridiales Family XIII bacterium]|jgi:Fe-S-cluster-containing dehydrogenase component|nr:oxidoreductase [Clostridiales Family XIII bacterium]